MTAVLASRVIAVIRTAARTARTHEEAEEARAVLAELEADAPEAIAPSADPAACDPSDLRVAIQAENAEAEKAAYGRADKPAD